MRVCLLGRVRSRVGGKVCFLHIQYVGMFFADFLPHRAPFDHEVKPLTFNDSTLNPIGVGG